MAGLLVFLVIVALVIVYAVTIYNGLVTLRENVKESSAARRGWRRRAGQGRGAAPHRAGLRSRDPLPVIQFVDAGELTSAGDAAQNSRAASHQQCRVNGRWQP